MCIAIIFCTVCDVKNFQIDYSFLIKPFFYITKMSGQKCKYLKSKKSFWYERNSLFLLFQRSFDYQKLSQIRKWAFNRTPPVVASVYRLTVNGCFFVLENIFVNISRIVIFLLYEKRAVRKAQRKIFRKIFWTRSLPKHILLAYLSNEIFRTHQFF